MKAPSTNIQAPEKLQFSNINPDGSDMFWSLNFGSSLELGTWMLVFSTKL
jgi:hypothetical protein